MGKIIILDENTANQIAAGEVIERPASVLKELAENSIDAGSKNIKIEISRGGISLIRVYDDGSGISPEDVEMAFERHGTSKIRTADDLNGIGTMGFRGEALPSIASVAKVTLETSESEGNGIKINIAGGSFGDKQKSSRSRGTTVTVRNLFFNTPARYKFLKNDTTETRYCTDIVSRLALAHTDIAFRYIANGNELIRTPGDLSLRNAVYCVYGREISQNLFEVEYNDGTYHITGFAGNRSAARGNRQNQTTFVNGRYVRSREVSAAAEKAYETEIMKGRFPFYILDIVFSPSLVDVNVHPAKSEVRFAKPNEVFSAVYHAVKNAIENSRGMATGASTQAKIKRGAMYDVVPESRPNASFFDETGKEKLKDSEAEATAGSNSRDYESSEDPVANKILHESLMKARKEFYDNISEDRKNPVVSDAGEEDSYEEKTAPDISILMNAAYTGVMFSTFLMFETGHDEIILIDQHAAHERITYEKLLRKFKSRKLSSQVLLAPEVVTLSQQEASVVEENPGLFKDLGFAYDFLGQRDVAVRAVPTETAGTGPGEVFIGAVSAVMDNAGREHILIEKEAIYTMACKSSVKANTALSDNEVRALVSQLQTLENPYTCPHGRPVVVKLTRRELEKLFKRIV